MSFHALSCRSNWPFTQLQLKINTIWTVYILCRSQMNSTRYCNSSTFLVKQLRCPDQRRSLLTISVLFLVLLISGSQFLSTLSPSYTQMTEIRLCAYDVHSSTELLNPNELFVFAFTLARQYLWLCAVSKADWSQRNTFTPKMSARSTEPYMMANDITIFLAELWMTL